MRNIIKKIRGLHFHKWEWVDTTIRNDIIYTFDKCNKCGRYIVYYKGRDIDGIEIDEETYLKHRRLIDRIAKINKLKSESKRRCIG